MTGAQARDPLAGRAGWLRQARSYLRAADPVLARLIDDRPDFDPGAWMTQLPAMDLFGALGHHRITVIHASLTLLARLCGDAFCTGEMRRQELSGLPPLIIQAGTHEVLLDDAIRLARQAATADVQVTLDITPGVPHVFQAYYPILDEAAAALDRAGQLLSAHLTGS